MIEEGKANVFDKPKDQSKLVCFGLVRKGRIKSNPNHIISRNVKKVSICAIFQ